MTDRVYRIDGSQRTAARVAALANLVAFPLIVFANFGMRSRLMVSGDVTETVRRIAAAESLFRLSVALNLVYCTAVVVVLTALYVVLSPANRHLALLATLWKLVYVVTAVLTALNLLSLVRLASNAADPQALGAEPLQSLVRLTTSATWDQYYIGLAFWALSSTVLGWLWLKSRYIPAALAIFGLVSSAWCAVCTFAYIINPAFARVVNLWWFDSPMAVFDIVLSLWLLVRGLARSAPSDATLNASSAPTH